MAPLAKQARSLLAGRTTPITAPANREALALDWAHKRGRISTTELGSVVGIAPGKTSSTLTALEEQGALHPSSLTRRGGGFHYRPVRHPGLGREEA